MVKNTMYPLLVFEPLTFRIFFLQESPYLVKRSSYYLYLRVLSTIYFTSEYYQPSSPFVKELTDE